MAEGESAQTLPTNRLEKQFPEKKPLMSRHEAVAEANRCLYCVDAPCIPSCPTAIDIPEFIRRISTDNVEGAGKVILDSNILGLSCASVCPTEVLCESTCVYTEMDEKPIEIGRLQRYATEHVYENDVEFYEAGPDSGRHVAMLGAGPASLSCAHALRRLGHAVTIYEARPRPGGLNTTGVAPYKLQADDSLREVEYITSIGGISIEYDCAVGEDVQLEELDEEFDAIFVGVGLGPDRYLDVPGNELEGVWGAVDFIERLKTAEDYELPEELESVAVIGGGNTAIDVVREMRGLGIEDVRLVYRKDETRMSGYDHEWAGALAEGVQGEWWSQPVEILGDDRVRALRCRETEFVVKPDGGKALREVEGSEFDIDCDLVVLAIGQSKLGELFGDVEGLEIDWGRIVVGQEGTTGNPKYFAGGDCANGGMEVVNAAAEGRRAAHAIDAYLDSNGDSSNA